MRKGRLDERQERVVEGIGSLSFMVMFMMCAIVITGELIWGGNIKSVAGETVVLAAGGAVYLAGTIKNGIWTKSGRRMSMGQKALLSIIFAGVFSVFYVLIISRKAVGNAGVEKIAGIFFIGIAVLCFLCLWGLEKLAWNRQEKEEKRCGEQ